MIPKIDLGDLSEKSREIPKNLDRKIKIPTPLIKSRRSKETSMQTPTENLS